MAHRELTSLSIAHMDCDAFYASVEKRDNPELRDKPLIVGGGHRGVVSTCCYIARLSGVRSAMPMFKARKLCPEAVVLRGRMDVYVEVSRQIRSLMEELTPAIEPLSLDEAFLDLSGTEKLHGAPPAVVLTKLMRRIEDEVGVTGSVGLSHNKFLAKIASDLDKPRGFSIISKEETDAFLADKPVSLIWGVGASSRAKLEAAGIRSFTDLRRWEEADLVARFGSFGLRLWQLARGQDQRKVKRDRVVKSISNETTFHDDTASAEVLDGYIWRMSEKVSDRAKAKELAGRVVTLKLKRADFSLVTRRVSLSEATQMTDKIYRTARELFDAAGIHGPFRLLGVGISDLEPAGSADRIGDLLDSQATQRAEAERATDAIRAKFGKDAIRKGRALR